MNQPNPDNWSQGDFDAKAAEIWKLACSGNTRGAKDALDDLPDAIQAKVAKAAFEIIIGEEEAKGKS